MLQALVMQGRALQLVVIAVFVTFVTLEATHVRVQSNTQPLLKAAASFACFCLALLLFQAGMLARGIYDNWKAGKQWYATSGSSLPLASPDLLKTAAKQPNLIALRGVRYLVQD